ncbi:MAG: twin-arginine translocase TatA/TatE family subunit [Chloroflexota bacterium]
MDFLGIGPIELLVIALIAFLFLGPERMMEMARSLGKIMRDVRRTTSELPSLLSLDEPIDQPPNDKAKDRVHQPGSDASDTQAKGNDER